MSEFLKDNNGKKSAKRLAGLVCIAIGLEMKIILFHLALFTTIQTSYDKLDNSSNLMFYIGSGLLGWGVTEFFSKK